MENRIQFQAEKKLDSDPLMFVSAMFLDASRTIKDIQALVVALLRYASLGVAIANCLTDWAIPVEES
ncbi:MAG: hypothetical protein ACM3Y8_07370 [Byssovorax cruenta]|jgi:hypothetical protein